MTCCHVGGGGGGSGAVARPGLQKPHLSCQQLHVIVMVSTLEELLLMRGRESSGSVGIGDECEAALRQSCGVGGGGAVVVVVAGGIVVLQCHFACEARTVS